MKEEYRNHFFITQLYHHFLTWQFCFFLAGKPWSKRSWWTRRTLWTKGVLVLCVCMFVRLSYTSHPSLACKYFSTRYSAENQNSILGPSSTFLWWSETIWEKEWSESPTMICRVSTVMLATPAFKVRRARTVLPDQPVPPVLPDQLDHEVCKDVTAQSAHW